MAKNKKPSIVGKVVWAGWAVLSLAFLLGAAKSNATAGQPDDADKAVIANREMLEHWEMLEHSEMLKHWEALEHLEMLKNSQKAEILDLPKEKPERKGETR